MPTSWKCWIYWISHEKTQCVLHWGLCQQPAKSSGGLYVHVRGEQSTPTALWASANCWPSPKMGQVNIYSCRCSWCRWYTRPECFWGVQFSFRKGSNQVKLDSAFHQRPLCSTFSCICLNLARAWSHSEPKCFGKQCTDAHEITRVVRLDHVKVHQSWVHSEEGVLTEQRINQNSPPKNPTSSNILILSPVFGLWCCLSIPQHVSLWIFSVVSWTT